MASNFPNAGDCGYILYRSHGIRDLMLMGGGETMRGEGAHLVTRNLSSVNGRTMVSNLKVGVMNCDHKRATMGVIRGIGSNNLWAAFTHNGGGANVTRV